MFQSSRSLVRSQAYFSAFSYEISTGAFTPLPDAPRGRSRHGCGVARNPSTGAAQLVALGGFEPNSSVRTNSTDILDLSTLEWRAGADLPLDEGEKGIIDVLVEPRGDTFWVLGGEVRSKGEISFGDM